MLSPGDRNFCVFTVVQLTEWFSTGGEIRDEKPIVGGGSHKGTHVFY